MKIIKPSFFLLSLIIFISIPMSSYAKSILTKIHNETKVLQMVIGDLDRDRIDEKVIIYDTGKMTDFGTEREVHIYKKHNKKWQLWRSTTGPVLPSAHGGIMGDPFQGMEIVRGSLVFYHSGGSRAKWNYTHRFRYQNGSWFLIGASVNVITPCEYWVSFDYNLLTQNAVYEQKNDSCNNEVKYESIKTRFKLKLKSLPQMKGFYPGNNKVIIPNYNEVIFY